MHKVLILTYYWPPAGGPGVQRWLYFVRYLSRFEIEPVVFVPEHPHYPLLDPDLEELVPEHLKKYTCEFWEPYGLAALLSKKKTRRISSGIIKREKGGWLERLLLWIRGNLFIPDARKYWLKPAMRMLPQILDAEGIQTIVTTGPPHSVHLIGQALKRRKAVRWIADFRDPWTDIGYHKALGLSRWAQRKHQRLEREVLSDADMIITTSGVTKQAFEALVSSKVQVITNGFDGTPASGSQPEGDFVVAHIGSLLSGRNPDALWAALAELCQEEPDFKEDLSLELTGLVSPEVKERLLSHGLWTQTIIRPYVTHQKALQFQRSAQVLLLIEIDTPATRGIVPGKLFEYMAAARPVLAVGPEGWEAAARLEEAKCGRGFTYTDQAAIASQLRDWYGRYRKGILIQDTKGVMRYSREALTEKLAGILWES